MSGSTTIELRVDGMTCSNCARHVTEAIQSVPRVHSAQVSLERKSATVRWNNGAPSDVSAVLAAVARAGYDASEAAPAAVLSPVTELQVAGMTCNNCARHVTEAIQSVPGVNSATVALEKKRATVRWNSTPDVPAVLAAIGRAGFEATEAPGAPGTVTAGRWQWNLVVGLAVTGTLMAGEWILGWGSAAWFQWFSLALATVVQVYCGAEFYAGAWRQLKVGRSNMDALVALGSTTAFAFSVWALLAHPGGHLYFMEAAAIISLISFGHWLEARVSERASGALKSLLTLAPQTARRISAPVPGAPPAKSLNLRALSFAPSPNGQTPAPVETEVPVSELRIGDRVGLRPGDGVPVDGVVLEGESAVNEAMLTGESAPVDKRAGSSLLAGTVNQNGRLVMRVTALGEATALARIVAAVQRAQTSRADIQRLGDRISNVFVPVIVALALAAGWWWGLAPDAAGRAHEWLAQFLWHAHAPGGAAAGFIVAAAVLIIACPCAMGLATPAAIMAAANTAARRGLLIRDGVALEKAGRITAVIFDKTGTLTVGKPEVATVWQNDAAPPALPLALALARHSTHPISQAVAAYCGQATPGAPELAVQDWQEIRGRGIEAKTLGGLLLGSLHWLREAGVNVVAADKFVAEWTGQGSSVVGLAQGNGLLALFAVRDSLKTHSRAVVADLGRQGLKTYLLTGDNRPTAAAIAQQAGIAPENVLAEVRPEQKADFVKQLQAKGESVAFVGDGINDAPALTQANLGIAVSRASDVAREAADIILLKSEIEAVPEALGLARAALRTIKQNLFWAFFYNALGVPLAALGFISPIFCAAAMAVSDLVVIGNALRLLRWRARRS